MKKGRIAVTQEIIEEFQNFKKAITTDIQEKSKSNQVEHLCWFRIRIHIGRLSKSYVFKSISLDGPNK